MLAKNHTRLNSLELFSGAGGLALGLEMAGFKTRAMLERDSFCCETLRKNASEYFPHAKIFDCDMTKVTPEEILKNCGLTADDVALIAGGPPCQGFSIAKESKGGRMKTDPRDEMVLHFIRFVENVRPRAFLMENVPGMMNKESGSIFAEFVKEFEALGYAVNFSLLNSADFGVPQFRKRLFVLGSRGSRKLNFPAVTHGTAKGLQKYITIKQTFSKLRRNMPNQDMPHHTEKKRQKLAAIKPGSAWSHWRYRDRFDSPSRCITGHCRDDWVHPIEARTGTVRELATLQSFPTDYEFCGPIMALNNVPYHFQYRQVGNAVPVLLAKAVGKSVIEQLGERSEAANGGIEGVPIIPIARLSHRAG